MRTLDEVRLWFPEGWGTRDEWFEAVEEVEDAEKPLVRLQAELSSQLSRAKDFGPEPALLGWLILWNRTFQTLEGLRGAIVRRSLQTGRVLERVSFETALHLMVIGEPWVRSTVRLGKDITDQAVRARLESFLAWCLWRDLKRWRDFSKPGNLTDLYDPAPGRDIVREHGEALGRLEPLLGEWETLTDAEADRERAQAERVAQSRIALFDRWLSDDRIVDRYSDLKNTDPHSFFQFLDADESRMRKILRARSIGYAYGTYDRGSSAIHGSTIEHGLFFRPPVLGPEIWAADDDLPAVVKGPLPWVRSCTLALFLMHPANLIS